MKKSLSLSLFSFLLMIFLFGCTEEETIESSQGVNPNSQVLTITENGITSSTFTFSVKASDSNIPYLVLYVDKATIDKVAKSDLPTYLMSELQSQASSLGKTFEAHLDSISVKGDLTEKKITKLLPGQIYELVAFAYSGTRPATKAETLFFQTLKVDPIECNFNTTINDIQAHEVNMTVAPSLEDKEWFITAVYEEDYQKYTNEYSFTNEYIIQSIFAQTYENVLAQLAEGDINNVTDALINEALNQLLFKGKQNIKLSNLVSERNFVYLIAAYDRALIDNITEPVLLSNATTGSFSTPKDPYNDVTFELSAKIHDGLSASISVIPSDKTQKFFWIYDAFNAENINYTAEEMAQSYVKMYGPMMQMMANYTGDQHIEGTVTPGSKNYILAFTYNRGITSAPAIYSYDVPEAGNPADMLISYGDAQITAYDLTVEASVTDKTILYGSVIVETAKYNETEIKATIEANIATGFKMNQQYNPQLTMESYLYSQNDYKPGNKQLGFVGLKAGTSYKVCSFVLNNEGKIVKTITNDYTTHTLSDATVEAKVEGVFKGEDANEIFGVETATGRSVLVMRYALGADSYNATYGVAKDNDKVTDSMDDYSIINGYNVPWNSVGKSGLSFVICDWNNKYYSFVYAKDKNGIQGKITRTYIENIKQSNAGTKERLQALYDETKDGTETTRSGMAVWTKQSEPLYMPAKVISVENTVNPYSIKLRKVESLKSNQSSKKKNNYLFEEKLSLIKTVF